MLSSRDCAFLAASVVWLFVAAASANAADDIESKVQGCNVCHGKNGAPINAATPIIWGQQGNYLYKELHDYHSGDRANPIMTPVAQGFTLEELRQIADYFAAKSWPAAAAAGESPPPDVLEKIVMCKACHGQNFEGGAPAPRLKGQSYQYLAASMAGFADDRRTNSGDMTKFAKMLTDGERDAIAHYLAGP